MSGKATAQSVSKKCEAENAALRAEMELLKADFNNKLALQEKTIENLVARMELTDSTVALQKNAISKLKDDASSLREKLDRQDQYHRRPNLRINGVALPERGTRETNSDIMKIVEEVCADLEVDVKPDDIFRAHRVGAKKHDNGRHHQAVIVRFRSWASRCALYRARPTAQRPRPKKTGPPPGRGYRSISLDLTASSYALLDKAKELIEEHYPDNPQSNDKNKVFAFSDLNCNLAIRFGEEGTKFFSNETQLDRIFDGRQESALSDDN